METTATAQEISGIFQPIRLRGKSKCRSFFFHFQFWPNSGFFETYESVTNRRIQEETLWVLVITQHILPVQAQKKESMSLHPNEHAW